MREEKRWRGRGKEGSLFQEKGEKKEKKLCLSCNFPPSPFEKESAFFPSSQHDEVSVAGPEYSPCVKHFYQHAAVSCR